jgi:hypothetical protein
MLVVGHEASANWAEIAQVVITLLALLAAVAVAVIYGRQLGVMQADRDRDSIVTLNKLLQDPSTREDRKTLFNLHERHQAVPGNEDYERAADSIGTNLQSVGFLVKSGTVRKELVIDNWGHSMKQMYALVLPWIEYREEREKTACDPLAAIPMAREGVGMDAGFQVADWFRLRDGESASSALSVGVLTGRDAPPTRPAAHALEQPPRSRDSRPGGR